MTPPWAALDARALRTLAARCIADSVIVSRPTNARHVERDDFAVAG